MTFMLDTMDVGHNAMLPRYGVHSVLDTPKLVFLDQRRKEGENRQLPYGRQSIYQEGVIEFLRAQGLEEVATDLGAATVGETKDEL